MRGGQGTQGATSPRNEAPGAIKLPARGRCVSVWQRRSLTITLDRRALPTNATTITGLATPASLDVRQAVDEVRRAEARRTTSEIAFGAMTPKRLRRPDTSYGFGDSRLLESSRDAVRRAPLMRTSMPHRAHSVSIGRYRGSQPVLWVYVDGMYTGVAGPVVTRRS